MSLFLGPRNDNRYILLFRFTTFKLVMIVKNEKRTRYANWAYYSVDGDDVDS